MVAKEVRVTSCRRPAPTESLEEPPAGCNVTLYHGSAVVDCHGYDDDDDDDDDDGDDGDGDGHGDDDDERDDDDDHDHDDDDDDDDGCGHHHHHDHGDSDDCMPLDFLNADPESSKFKHRESLGSSTNHGIRTPGRCAGSLRCLKVLYAFRQEACLHVPIH